MPQPFLHVHDGHTVALDLVPVRGADGMIAYGIVLPAVARSAMGVSAVKYPFDGSR